MVLGRFDYYQTYSFGTKGQLLIFPRGQYLFNLFSINLNASIIKEILFG
jgi:hypothetical protein